VLGVLLQYDFPGNVRELENMIEHAFVMCRGEEIHLQHLPPEFSQFKLVAHEPVSTPLPLHDAERQTILEALEKHNWNKVETAKALGLHRTTLWRKMKQYGLI
jgi:transcriptional regulator of acetoin/glycerol metabolism